MDAGKPQACAPTVRIPFGHRVKRPRRRDISICRWQPHDAKPVKINVMIDDATRVRIDKWLWAARFYKTRTLAAQAIDRHHVQVAGVNVKPAREVKLGELITVRQGWTTREVTVLELSAARRSASVAQQLYRETAESLAARELAATRHRLAPEPAQGIVHGRPTKRDRRALDRQRAANWNARWSATVND